MQHAEIVGLVVAYTLTGAFVFTVVVTCIALLIPSVIPSRNVRRALMGTLILEVAAGGVGYYLDFLKFNPKQVAQDIGGRAAAKALVAIEPPIPEPNEAQRDVVAPAVEYVSAFEFPPGSPASIDQQALLKQLRQSAGETSPEKSNAVFWTNLNTFRDAASAYAETGKWQRLELPAQ
ncbi:MAG: hypothetical protein KF774_18025 [Planctomyces sp.]|nr:hypothetical protein [Planctomyces sp.]